MRTTVIGNRTKRCLPVRADPALANRHRMSAADNIFGVWIESDSHAQTHSQLPAGDANIHTVIYNANIQNSW